MGNHKITRAWGWGCPAGAELPELLAGLRVWREPRARPRAAARRMPTAVCHDRRRRLRGGGGKKERGAKASPARGVSRRPRATLGVEKSSAVSRGRTPAKLIDENSALSVDCNIEARTPKARTEIQSRTPGASC